MPQQSGQCSASKSKAPDTTAYFAPSLRKGKGDSMGNPVMQFQILSKTPDETAQFYSALFGWKISADNPLGYRQIDTGSETGIQGGIWPAPPQSPNFVQLFMAVDDVKASVEKAEALGAKLAIPPTTLPEGDEMAVMLDPQGMSFALLRSAK
jgi:predicted enzyme related to lactoylglutathione lyase